MNTRHCNGQVFWLGLLLQPSPDALIRVAQKQQLRKRGELGYILLTYKPHSYGDSAGLTPASLFIRLGGTNYEAQM